MKHQKVHTKKLPQTVMLYGIAIIIIVVVGIGIVSFKQYRKHKRL